MNKIYRTVYNEHTHTWVATCETAKANRKSSNTVVNCTNASISKLKRKSYALTAVVSALAISVPFMATEAQAYVLCKNGEQVFARSVCNGGETLLWVSNDTAVNKDSNNNGIAIGGDARAIGSSVRSSIAIGKGARAAIKNKVNNVEDPSFSEVEGAIAIGENAWSMTPYAITIGSANGGQQGLGGRAGNDPDYKGSKDTAIYGGYSIAIGHRAANFLTNGEDINAHYYANTKYATAIGALSHTHAPNTLAMGFSTDATGARAFALGSASTEVDKDDIQHKGARAGGQGSIVIGDRAIAYSKTGGEVETDTNVNDAVAIGTGSHVKARNSLALGGGISYTYYVPNSSGSVDVKTAYYDENDWRETNGVIIARADGLGAKVGKEADGAIALGGATADITGEDNDYYPSKLPTAANYIKAAEVAEGAKRAIAMGTGSQVGGKITLDTTYSSKVNDENAEDITGPITVDKKGVDSVALGSKNAVLEDESTAVGHKNLVLTKNSGALGYNSVVAAKTSYALGNSNILGNNNAGEIENVFAFGNNITNTANNSVFLGDSTAYVKAQYDVTKEDKGSTAGLEKYEKNAEDIYFIDGSGNKTGIAINKETLKYAGAEPVGVVSVGAAGSVRRIQNVAAGLISEESTDAINGSQLYHVVQKLNAGGGGTTIINNYNDVSINAGSNISVTKNGSNNYTIATTRDINVEGDLTVAGDTTVNNFTVNPNSNVDMGGNQIHNVAAGTADTDAVNVGQLNQAIGDVNNKINAVSKHADAAAAAAIAVASLPQSYLPGKNLIAIGGGTYNGQSGYAIGLSTISDNGAWIFKATATGNSKKRFGAGVGAGFLW
ncbi:MAG: YadA-like family protein [Neisseriaceae bacterium]|nr:YadA-like family protein [Neisseriaceae bacterium]